MVAQESESREPIKLPEKVVTAMSTAVQNLTVEASPLLRGNPVHGGLEDNHELGSGVAQVGWPSLTDPNKGRDQGVEGAIQMLSKELADHDSQLALLAVDAEAQPVAGPAATDGSQFGPDAAPLLDGVNGTNVKPGADARPCTKMDRAAGGGDHSLAAPGGSTNLVRWRLHREEQEEHDVFHTACVTHVQFGVPTPPNSGSSLSSGKRCMSDGQDLVVSFKSTSYESIESRGFNVVPPACKKVCGERVETMVGIDGNMVHAAEGRRRESVGEGKEEEGSVKDATNLGAVGQLTGACDDARQEP
ncbi:hypothetical protein VPH35_061869 [Triticum aestivum]